MKRPLNALSLLALACAPLAASPGSSSPSTPCGNRAIVRTPAYAWRGDSVIQGQYVAHAPDSNTIISTYSAQPGYFMPVEKEWRMKNDVSAYPQLHTPNTLHSAIYNMGLDEMVNAVEPDTTLRTGREWPGVWTRDVSYSILLSMAYMQPEASRISLMKKVDSLGRIIQDTGSGGAWPISTDREIWVVAAWELYLVTGDRQWLEYIYPIAKRSLETDADMVMDPQTGLVRGETSFIDWREQSHPKWMQTADIAESQTLSTSVVHARAWQALAEMASILGHRQEAARARAKAESIAAAVNRELWMEDKGFYAMYLYGAPNPLLNPRSETLGESLAILWGVAPPERGKRITESVPTTPFGVGVFHPQIADMPPYHNNALWPWVAAWWTLANAREGNEQGVLEGFGSIFRPAALFATNKENLRLDNGDIATELNSSNMLWCLAGNLALTHRILFGIDFRTDGLHLDPFVPEALADERSLTGFPYRDATLDITVRGHGANVASFKVNGKERRDHTIPPNAKGLQKVEIQMDNRPIPAMEVNRQPNASAPLTPLVSLRHSADYAGEHVPVNNLLSWEPIEYIDHYLVLRDGRQIARTTLTSMPAVVEGTYQVIGVAADGTPSFASKPLSNRIPTTVNFTERSRRLESPEMAYAPKDSLSGYFNGFVELDHASAPVTARVSLPAGRYSVRARYANGNGPVNTENKAAIRSLTLDGQRVGSLTMPQRGVGNWNEWGLSTSLVLTVSEPGEHEIGLLFLPNDENMNIMTNHVLVDRLEILPLAD